MKSNIDSKKVLSSLQDMNDRYSNLHNALSKCCGLVEGAAKQNLANSVSSGSTGQLANSIFSVVGETQGEVRTNLQYGIYVHQGTRAYARDGNGHAGYWVYVEGSDIHRNSPSPNYTLEEAKKAKAMLISEGIEADKIHITNGQHPNPFLERALDDNRENIGNIFKQEGAKK